MIAPGDLSFVKLMLGEPNGTVFLTLSFLICSCIWIKGAVSRRRSEFFYSMFCLLIYESLLLSYWLIWTFLATSSFFFTNWSIELSMLYF